MSSNTANIFFDHDVTFVYIKPPWSYLIYFPTNIVIWNKIIYLFFSKKIIMRSATFLLAIVLCLGVANAGVADLLSGCFKYVLLFLSFLFFFSCYSFMSLLLLYLGITHADIVYL